MIQSRRRRDDAAGKGFRRLERRHRRRRHCRRRRRRWYYGNAHKMPPREILVLEICSRLQFGSNLSFSDNDATSES